MGTGSKKNHLGNCSCLCCLGGWAPGLRVKVTGLLLGLEDFPNHWQISPTGGDSELSSLKRGFPWSLDYMWELEKNHRILGVVSPASEDANPHFTEKLQEVKSVALCMAPSHQLQQWQL